MWPKPPYGRDKDRKQGSVEAARPKTQEMACNINKYKHNAQFSTSPLCLY